MGDIGRPATCSLSLEGSSCAGAHQRSEALAGARRRGTYRSRATGRSDSSVRCSELPRATRNWRGVPKYGCATVNSLRDLRRRGHAKGSAGALQRKRRINESGFEQTGVAFDVTLKMRAEDRESLLHALRNAPHSPVPHRVGRGFFLFAHRLSAPLPIGRAEHRDGTEDKKHRAKNVSIPRPSRDCAEQRQEGEQSEVARLGVHFRPD
jgi:hypothetical protein